MWWGHVLVLLDRDAVLPDSDVLIVGMNDVLIVLEKEVLLPGYSIVSDMIMLFVGRMESWLFQIETSSPQQRSRQGYYRTFHG